MKKYKYTFLLLLCFSTCIQAWEQQLKVGDKLENIHFENVLSFYKDKFDLNEFKGKYIILDLWATSCSVCIQSFPKYVGLQKKFSEKLQIIAINKDGKDKTRKLLEKIKVNNSGIPFATEDTQVIKIFPKNYNPWIVWINDKGFVEYITDGKWVTESNIQKFIEGKHPDMEQNEYLPSQRKRQPLLTYENGRYLDKVDYYSYLAHCIKGKSIDNLEERDTSGTFFMSRNCLSAVNLLSEAFCEGKRTKFAYKNQIKLNVDKPYPLMEPKIEDTGWRNRFLYSYEIAIPHHMKNTIYKMMQEDLQRLFNLDAKVSIQKVPCLVLIRIDSIDRLRTAGGSPFSNVDEELSGRKVGIKNRPFSEFAYRLRELFNPYYFSTPFIDGTGYNGLVDIFIDQKLFEVPDLPAMRLALRTYGLDIKLQDHDTDVLVISERRR